MTPGASFRAYTGASRLLKKGALGVGFSAGAVPIYGGTLYVDPVAGFLPVTVSGALGVAGAGSLNIPLLFSSPAVAGLVFYVQGGFVDPTAGQGVSCSNAVLVEIG